MKKWRDMTEAERLAERRARIDRSAAIGLAKGCLMAAREVRKGSALASLGVSFRRPAERRIWFETYLSEAAHWRRFAKETRP